MKHPQVFVPQEKEIMFFTRHYGRGIEWYEKCFSKYEFQKYAADISPSYLSSRDAPNRMRKHLSNIKILAILRNPPDQIWSLYNLWKVRNYTRKNIKKILEENKELLNNVMYFEHLSNYMDCFDKKDILILFYEDLKTNPKTFLESLYRFLEIDNLFEESFFKYWNQSRNPRSMIIEKIIVSIGEFLHHSGQISVKAWLNSTGISEALKSLNTKTIMTQSMPQDIRSFINAHIYKDKESLAKLTNRDLSFWK